MTESDALDKIDAVHEKYKHLDIALSDTAFVDSVHDQARCDMWQVIRDISKRKGECWNMDELAIEMVRIENYLQAIGKVFYEMRAEQEYELSEGQNSVPRGFKWFLGE